MAARTAHDPIFVNGASAETTTAGTISASGAVSVACADLSTYPSGGIMPVGLNIGESDEEHCWATRSGNTLIVDSADRGSDGTSATGHATGITVNLIQFAEMSQEANDAVVETMGKIGAAGEVLVGDGAKSLAALDLSGNAKIPVGNGTTITSVAVSGDVTMDNAGAVTIADEAVETGMIAADAVTGDLIADDAVDSEHYTDGSIDNPHLADEAVGLEEMTAAAKPRWVVGPFRENAVAADSADQAGFGSVGSPGTYVCAEAGAVVGISAAHSFARDAGAYSWEVYKNGSATGFKVTIDGTNTQYHYNTQAATADTVAAGDRIDVRGTDDGSWGTASGAYVTVMFQAV